MKEYVNALVEIISLDQDDVIVTSSIPVENKPGDGNEHNYPAWSLSNRKGRQHRPFTKKRHGGVQPCRNKKGSYQTINRVTRAFLLLKIRNRQPLPCYKQVQDSKYTIFNLFGFKIRHFKHLIIKNAKSPLKTLGFQGNWRRVWDSNPRGREPKRFSRLFDKSDINAK